jgi:hypothetical protein
MVTTGGSMSGYSRRGSLPKETRPKTINSSEITAANTGRFTETSDRIIGPGPPVPGSTDGPAIRCLVHGNNGHRLSRSGAQGTVVTTNSPASRPSSISTSPGLRPPMVTWRRWATVDSADRSTTSTWLSRPDGNQRLLGNHQNCPRIFQQARRCISRPGFSRRSGLGRIALTTIVRVTGSIRLLMLATVPSNLRPAKAGEVASMGNRFRGSPGESTAP